jgi:DNA-binding transcriptional ArsR family regulator
MPVELVLLATGVCSTTASDGACGRGDGMLRRAAESRDRDVRAEAMKSLARIPLSELQASDTHVEAFKALAHLARLQVFFFLVRAGKEMSVGEIQEEVEIPGPTLSHHLDVLRRAGLVESRKEERYVYYAVKRESVTTLVRLLTACC